MKNDFQFSLQWAHTHENILDDLEKGVNTYRKTLTQVVAKKDWEAPEASLLLPSSKEANDQVQTTLQGIDTASLKLVVVVGIGGSNLGTKAVYEAVFGTLDHTNDRLPKVLFADTVAPTTLQGIAEAIANIKKKQEVLLVVVSKSGGTTETIANFEYLYALLTERFGEVRTQIAAITGAHSPLAEQAREYGWHVLTIPKNVGGRFSVFSTVGLFPLSLVGLSRGAMLDGALEMRDQCLQPNWRENPALASALTTYVHLERGLTIHNTFVFNPEWESVGKWERQLVGESLGKEKDLDGNKVYAGITPIVSIGSTDLHSMAQLYFGGPRDKLTTFVYHSQTEFEQAVPNTRVLPNMVHNIAGKRHARIMDAIFEGVKESYKQAQLPFMEVSLGFFTEHTVAKYLQFKMMQVMYLAKLLNVNAFDQPNVEAYKRETKRLLET